MQIKSNLKKIMIMEPKSLLERLLIRGDFVAIENGRLKLESANGNTIPDEWLLRNRTQIIAEIIKLINMDAFSYESYSTGNYLKCPAGGVTLQFTSLLTGESVHVIFNAELTRNRNTKYGDKGKPLPKGHFRVDKKFAFFKFWKATGLLIPKRLSSFHDHMGKLQELVFTGGVDHKRRIQKDTISLLTVTHQQLHTAFQISRLPDKPRTTPGHSSDNSRTIVPDKHSPLPHAQQAVQPITTTGENNHDTSKQGNAGIRGNVFPLNKPKRPEEQSVDEWLDGYGPDSFKGSSDKT